MLESSRPHIVVGTPGCVLDLIKSNSLKVGTVRRFVVDECDHLLEDMRSEVQAIFLSCPRDKQVMMFTATLSAENKKIAEKFCVHVSLVF